MTQNYTPVAWQDETTSQQGTLINAERLNQMQTAHHYADGFEEVDAIPTADPGVDYHKVVYCTADSTFYRWDGTAWTADIDDDTKRLLLEHEADHDNPHQVTKAQVGLGNADNTSDQNKPVSTAQAAAIKLVQDYLDAHEANHDNPHQVTKAQVGLGNADNTSDADKPISTATQTALDAKADQATTYTKTETDTLLAAKADKADTYDKTAVDGLLAGKVDKLISSPAGTYKSVTVNAQGQVTAGTNPTTLSGYGITDAYTKSETDTLLGAKANDNAVVHLAGDEDIGGTKTFTSRLHVSSIIEASTNLQNSNLDYTTPNNVGVRITMFAKGDITDLTNRVAVLRTYLRNGGHNTFYLTQMGKDGQGGNISSNIELHLNQPTWGNAVLIPSPASNAPSNAAATLATLDSYLPMVRTSGNQSTSGFKEGTWLGHRITDPISYSGGWLHYLDVDLSNYGFKFLEITPSTSINTTNDVMYAKVLFARYNRVYPIVNIPGIGGIKVVSLYNANTTKWEVWIYTDASRNTNYVNFFIVGTSAYTVVNTPGEFPTDTSNVTYILGSA